MTLIHKKTCRNKLTLSSSSLMFRLKEKNSVFRNFFDQWNFSIEDCTFIHCSALEKTNIFVQSSLDIIFHAIEWGVTTCPGYGESCRTQKKITMVVTPNSHCKSVIKSGTIFYSWEYYDHIIKYTIIILYYIFLVDIAIKNIFPLREI